MKLQVVLLHDYAPSQVVLPRYYDITGEHQSKKAIERHYKLKKKVNTKIPLEMTALLTTLQLKALHGIAPNQKA